MCRTTKSFAIRDLESRLHFDVRDLGGAERKQLGGLNLPRGRKVSNSHHIGQLGSIHIIDSSSGATASGDDPTVEMLAYHILDKAFY